MFGGLVDFTYDETKAVLLQSSCGFALERIQIAHRRRQFNTAIPSYSREIGLSGGCRGLTDARATIDLVIEDKDS